MSIASKQNFIYEVKENLKEKFNYCDLDFIINNLTNILDGYNLESIENENDNYKTYLDCFIDSKRIEGRSDKTIERYEYIISKFFKTTNIPIKNVTVFHLRNYLSEEKQRGLNDKTLNGMRNVFSSFFGWLWKEGLLKDNPCANLSSIKCLQKIRTPYNDTEIEKLKENCDSLRDKALICFLLSTGCRISEVCSLNIDNINFDKLECKVLGKGNKERIVYINDVTAMLLKRYIDSRNDNKDALFIGKGTDRMTPSGIRSRLHSIGDKANVENVDPHRFRRTLATNLINHGMTIQEVATILGHEKIDTTMMYIYIAQENVKNSYKKFSF